MSAVLPQLLVSVRDADEARIALLCGVSILDIKEPQSGSLGMASAVTIQQILDVVAPLSNPPLVSVALGEVLEWDRGNRHPLPAGLSYVKLGMAGLGHRSDWRECWEAVLRDIDRNMPAATPSPQRVAVAYVDSETADAPDPGQIIDVAQQFGCQGVLFDTWSKTVGTLFDSLPGEEITRLIDEIHAHGMFAAVAGRLTAERIPDAIATGADIIAVRSAACISANRQGMLDATAIAALQRRLGNSNLAEVVP